MWPGSSGNEELLASCVLSYSFLLCSISTASCVWANLRARSEFVDVTENPRGFKPPAHIQTQDGGHMLDPKTLSSFST